MTNSKIYKHGNHQKHVIVVNLRLREYRNRIPDVKKALHAKYELCSCPERRVMTILRPPVEKIRNISAKYEPVSYTHLTLPTN